MHIINNLNIKLKHNKRKTKYQIDTIKYRKFISSNQNQNQAKYSPILKNQAIKKLILGNSAQKSI